MIDNRQNPGSCAQVLEVLETCWVDGFEVHDTVLENRDALAGDGAVTGNAVTGNKEDWYVVPLLGELHER